VGSPGKAIPLCAAYGDGSRRSRIVAAATPGSCIPSPRSTNSGAHGFTANTSIETTSKLIRAISLWSSETVQGKWLPKFLIAIPATAASNYG
jgi:hypothetical protein